MRIVRREEYALMAGNACQDEALRAEMLQQQFERSRLEGGVPRLEHEVVRLRRAQHVHDVGAGRVRRFARLDQRAAVGAPST